MNKNDMCAPLHRTVQWLLIGGPADGKTVYVRGGQSIGWVDHEGSRYCYQGQNYFFLGAMYRVGCLDVNDLVPSRVHDLIRSTGVKPIGD